MKAKREVGIIWTYDELFPWSEYKGGTVDRELRTSGHTEYGTTCLGRMERYIGRDALGIRRGKLPRSTICEMQARNRSFGICKLWEHGVGRVGWQI